MSEDRYVSGEQREVAAPPESVQSDSQSGQARQEQNVPLSALQAERAQRQKMEEELRLIRDHLTLLQANQSRSQETPKDEFDGMADNDVMTVGEFKKIANKFNQQVQMTVEELRMTQKYPDYEEVIKRYLPDVVKNNPGLQRTLQSSQDYELAYYLAKNSDTYRSENRKSQRNADAERIVQNSQMAGSLSSIGQTSPINTARRYRDMSDDDFRKEVSKNMGYN